MKLWCFSHCRNERALAGFFARHYSQFAEQIHIFDDGSDDGTQEILSKYPKVTLHPIQMGGLDEDGLLNLAYEKYPMARGKCDYAAWVDMDEFLVHPNILACLARYKSAGYEVVRTLGFNAMGGALPADDGVSQLADIFRTGVRAPVYSKPIIFNPKRHVTWSRGKHTIQDETGLKLSPLYKEYLAEPDCVKLVHYRYLNPEYCRERNAKQVSRIMCAHMGWAQRADYTGEHSPDWVARTQHLARDIISPDACYLPPPFDA